MGETGKSDNKKKKHHLSVLEPAVLPALSSIMKIDIAVNERSDIWILHDRPFGEVVKWAEYDADNAKVFLVMSTGRQQELGIVITPDMHNVLQHGHQVFLVLLQNEKIADFGMVPFMTRGALLH